MIIEENGHHAGKVYMVVVEDETYNKHWQCFCSLITLNEWMNGETDIGIQQEFFLTLSYPLEPFECICQLASLYIWLGLSQNTVETQQIQAGSIGIQPSVSYRQHNTVVLGFVFAQSLLPDPYLVTDTEPVSVIDKACMKTTEQQGGDRDTILR